MKYLLLYLLIVIPNIIRASIVYQFEDGTLDNISSIRSVFEITDERSIDGKNSLKWDFEPSGSLMITGFELPTVNWYYFFAINIYNETPMEDKKIVFNLDGARTFYMNLNFKGWRTIWVNHFNDMQGDSRAVDKLTITAPDVSGTLYIDQIVPIFRPNNRLAYGGDIHVPYVNRVINQQATEFNWYAKLRYYNRLGLTDPTQEYSQEEIDYVDTITKRYEELMFIPNIVASDQVLSEIKDQLDYLKTRRISMATPYTALSWITNQEVLSYSKDTEFREVGVFLRKIAYAYRLSVNQEYKDTILAYYLDMMDYLYDQGWNVGSGMGSNSHIGYAIREFTESVFFLRDVLKESGEMDRIQKMLTWFVNLGGVVNIDPREIVGVNMDVLNTLSSGTLTTILSLENPHVKIKMLYEYQDYFNKSFESSVGLTGGYKPDGSGYHHRMHYPGYGDPALVGFGPVLYSLGKTPFAISTKAHELMRNYLLMSRRVANKLHIMLLTSGRHPNGKAVLPEESFRYFALTGTPDQSQDIDREVASAYLRLFPNTETANDFRSIGIIPESDPNGSWTMNRASLQIHRQKDWLVGARGFSRYLVGTEIYLNDNRYGRYFGYGQFQYMKQDMTNSGFVMEGFDWNHFPGTTAINLPYEELEAIVQGTEMLVQAETFSGGNSLNNSGLFAMKLKENKRYDGTHVARKSIFFLDNRLVFLGSGINNTNTNNTHTAIFQNYLGVKLNTPPQTNNNMIVLNDSVANTYYVPLLENTNLIYFSGLQNSFHEKTKEATANNFEKAYINHGANPKNQSYRYYMLVQGSQQEKSDFLTNPQFEIRQQNNNAHIVYDNKNKITHYVLFEPVNIDDKYIYGSSHPATLLLKEEENNQLKISYVNPDLALYTGVSQEDVNIYATKWGNYDVIPIRNYLELKGRWFSDDTAVKLTRIGKKTVVEMITKGGSPVQFTVRTTKEKQI